VRPDVQGSSGATLPGGRAGGVVAMVLTLLVGLLGPANPAAAVDPTPTPLVTGWLPSWATDTALAGVEGNADLIGEASPFWYTATASGGSVAVATSVSADTRARENNITVCRPHFYSFYYFDQVYSITFCK